MKTIVFYSYKGGRGQTLALMHAAWILAREGGASPVAEQAGEHWNRRLSGHGAPPGRIWQTLSAESR